MLTTKSATIALITITLVLLFAFTAAAEEEASGPRARPCDTGSGVSNISNDQTDNPDMALNVTSSNESVCVYPGGTNDLVSEGGRRPIHWSLTQTEGSGLSIESGISNENNNVVSASESASGSATVEVSDGRTPPRNITVTVDDEYSGEPLAWDSERSPTVYNYNQSYYVRVYVTGGQAPYSWEVSEGFRLSCYENCGQMVAVYREESEECVAYITAKDKCGATASGQVAKPWDWFQCASYKLTACNVSDRCGESGEILIDDTHKISVTCCAYGADVSVQRLCAEDPSNFTYTATADQCTTGENHCGDRQPKIFSFYIYRYKCY